MSTRDTWLARGGESALKQLPPTVLETEADRCRREAQAAFLGGDPEFAAGASQVELAIRAELSRRSRGGVGRNGHAYPTAVAA